MQMSNVILPQKENIDLDTFPSLTRIQYLHVNNKTRKYKHFYHLSVWCSNLVIFVKF